LGDLCWLYESFARPGRPDTVSRTRALLVFGTEFLRFPHYDCFDRRDLGPFVGELRNTARAVRVASRLRRAPHATAPVTEAATMKKSRSKKTSNAASDDVVVLGAGPYGLSISAHLRWLGIDHRVVGRPLEMWREHMPAGMNLKSEPYASEIAAPTGGYDLEAYCRVHGLDYVERLGAVTRQRFVDYADWYADSLAPEVTEDSVTELSPSGDGYSMTFAGGSTSKARKVVVATGVLPYATKPMELAGMPIDLVSHSADHHELDQFKGRRVAVVGAGQSALETAALLHESGAEAVLVVRRPAILWLEPNPERLSRLGHLRRPVTKLCEGWLCAFYNSPAAFGLLPRDVRTEKARTVLGPSGAWWLKDRVDGIVETLTSHQVRGVVAHGSGVRLLVAGPRQTTLDVDHVITATGFRVDVSRLPFLTGPLVARIATLDGFPDVSRAGESTAPGLYFAGAAAAGSLGPSTRFIAGTHTSVAPLAHSLARSLGAGRRRAAARRAPVGAATPRR
jgi:FAD-dependent urate hydroxylase